MTKKNRSSSRRIGNVGHSVYEVYSAALPKRTTYVTEQLSIFRSVFRELFSDENFRTLMRAEGKATIPIYLEPIIQEVHSHAMEDD